MDGVPLDGVPLDGVPLDGVPLDGVSLDGHYSFVIIIAVPFPVSPYMVRI